LGNKGSYKNGNREGLFEQFDENGQLKTKIKYKNNRYHDLYEEYDKDGNLMDTKLKLIDDYYGFHNYDNEGYDFFNR
jgi:antitoxin component YwqK of YwqJK toxin-antitoxin module